MIKTKKELIYYLNQDKIALGETRKHPRLFHDRIWKYQILYRKTEYYYNNRKKSIIHMIKYMVFNNLFKYWSMNWGNEFPLNCIGPGLRIWHGQNIIINGEARIGSNFSISTGSIVGQAKNRVPTIGNNVRMSAHSMVLGNISIADDVMIGAGAVVVKSITERNTVWVGIPAYNAHKQGKSENARND